MPAALALGDLGAVLVAALATLLAAGVYVLLRALAAVIGNIGIGPFTFHLGRTIAGALDGAASWIVDQTKGMWSEVGKIFHATAWIFSQIFGDVVQAIVHVGDQIAHIVTSVVPNAIHAAESAAGAHAEHLVADVKTGIAAAEADVARAIGPAARAAYETAARDASSVEHNLTAAISAGVDEAVGYTDLAIHGLHQIVTSEIATARKLVEGELSDTKVLLARQISSLANTVASDFTAAKDAAYSDAAAALQTARGLVQDARTYAEQTAAADAGAVQKTLQAAIDHLSGTVTDLTSTVSANLTTAEAYARSQVAEGVQTVTDQLTATAGQLQQSIDQASAAAAAGVQGALGAAQKDAAGALDQAEKVLGDALAGVTSGITGHAIAFGGDLSSVEQLLAGAITAAVAGVAARVAHLEKCSVGVCKDSANPFSKVLQDALGVAEAGSVFAMLAKMIQDPAAAEQEYADLIAGAYGGGKTLFDTLLSL